MKSLLIKMSLVVLSREASTSNYFGRLIYGYFFSVAVFTSWILSRILCVLAEADCSLLHDKSISAILSLLQVRGYGVWFFSLIAIVHV